MRTEVKVVGVDGCKGGWLAVAMANEGLTVQLFPDITALADAHADADRVLIDIPIGLPFISPRRCDFLARRLLGPRASSVFSVPVRSAVRAGSYAEACSENRRLLGRSVSRQTWNICPRIREVDDWLQQERRPGWLREAHPELCFWALAGGRPMRYSKRTSQGLAERRALLSRQSALNLGLAERPPPGSKPDDLLDALALAITAHLPAADLQSLPTLPPRDERGLPMEIVFNCRLIGQVKRDRLQRLEWQQD